MAFTFFFRDIHILENVAKHFKELTLGRSNIQVWDAGCAMGQEPYSLAIILAEVMGSFSFRNLNINATDYESGFEKIVKEGTYPYVELERIPEDLFKKYFHKADKTDHYQLEDIILDKVKFQYHDLLSLKPIGSNFSLVMCKNVLLHFQPEERIDVIKMFHSSLAPGGLFVTEHTQKLPSELSCLFDQLSSDAQIFVKK
jgi:chemotaxis protein methyltransferase CheR